METVEARTDEPIVDKIGGLMEQAVAAMPPPARAFLGGDWLGHPLHPMLTDIPIGFWTSSFVLDFLGGRRSRRISTAFVGLGVASAAPTVAAGLVEFDKFDADDPKRKTAVVHMAANSVGTFFYLWSFFARLRGRRGKGILLALVGAAAATAGGFLGGKLAFESSDKQAEPHDDVPPVPATEGTPNGSERVSAVV